MSIHIIFVDIEASCKFQFHLKFAHTHAHAFREKKKPMKLGPQPSIDNTRGRVLALLSRNSYEIL